MWEHAKAMAQWAVDKCRWMQAVIPWDGLNSLLYVLKCLAEFGKVPSQLCGNQLLLSGSWVEPLRTFQLLDGTGWHQGFWLGYLLFPDRDLTSARGEPASGPRVAPGTYDVVAATFPGEAFPNPVTGFILSWAAVMGVSPNPLVSASLFQFISFHEFRCP